MHVLTRKPTKLGGVNMSCTICVPQQQNKLFGEKRQHVVHLRNLLFLDIAHKSIENQVDGVSSRRRESTWIECPSHVTCSSVNPLIHESIQLFLPFLLWEFTAGMTLLPPTASMQKVMNCCLCQTSSQDLSCFIRTTTNCMNLRCLMSEFSGFSALLPIPPGEVSLNKPDDYLLGSWDLILSSVKIKPHI